MSVIAAFMVPHPPMIVPEIGRGSEKQILKTVEAYKEVARKIAELKPETIVISSPHSVMYADYFHISPGDRAFGSFSDFRAPEVRFDLKYDTEFTKRLCEILGDKTFPAGTLGEKSPYLDHGTMVPLWFILKEYSDFKLVRTGLSGLDLLKHYEYGTLIKKASEELNRRTVFVASGDLSHKLQDYGPYGFAEEGPKYDKRIMEVCGSGDFSRLFDFDEDFCDKAAECGHRSFVIMAGALDGVSVSARALSHEDVTGVGYGICEFLPEGEDNGRCFLDIRLKDEEKKRNDMREKEDEYVRLARASAEYFVKNKKEMPLPDGVSSELLKNRAGAFVSIHKFGRLRGCIGTILPVQENLASEIIHNAVSAVSEDPRFNEVTEDELPFLEINVDVLTEPEKISSKDELDVKRYGVIVKHGFKRGLLLPDLPGVDTIDDQIDIARRKGNISKDADYELFRFEVVRHKPEE